MITYEDSLTLPENRFEEIVHGESRIMPPATKGHNYLIQKLSRILEKQLDEAVHEVLTQGFGLGIGRVPLTCRIPDLMVFRTEALRQDRAGTARNDPYIWATPELIVECLSPSNRKGPIQELLADYARIEVPEVWLLDPKEHQFTSYLLADRGFQDYRSQTCGIVTSARMPNVTVPIDELWRAFDPS